MQHPPNPTFNVHGRQRTGKGGTPHEEGAILEDGACEDVCDILIQLRGVGRGVGGGQGEGRDGGKAPGGDDFGRDADEV